MGDQKKILIDYHPDERQWAEWIAWTLEDNDIGTVLEAWDARPGFPAFSAREVLNDVSGALVILSQSYLNSASHIEPFRVLWRPGCLRFGDYTSFVLHVEE